MKRIFCFALTGLLLFSSYAYAQLSGNASPVVVTLDGTTTYKNISFEAPTRNITIRNDDSTQYVFVDLTSGSNTSDRSRCFALAPGDSESFYDFATTGISVLWDNGTFAAPAQASPIYVIATF